MEPRNQRTPSARLRQAVAIGLVALGLLGLQQQLRADEPKALVLEVEGIVSPVMQRQLDRGLRRTEAEEARLVIVVLDTPGGLFDATQKIVKRFLNSPVPIAVYVPRGGRADSAGTFITTAAHVAVMGPGSRIGAASPVGGQGEDLPATLKSKAMEAAAALARSIAQERHRNAQALEATVLQAKSYDPQQALELGVVDFLAQDLEELLTMLDGREVTTARGPVKLQTHGLRLEKVTIGPLERFLRFLADPNVVFLLITIGGLGIVVEVLNPGLIAPGIIGGISLVLAFVSIGNLPVNWGGVALLLLAFALFVAEVLHAGFGLLGVGALVSFVLGALLLFAHFGTPHPTLPSVSVRVSLWALAPVTAVLAALGGVALVTMRQSQKPAPQPSVSSLVGAVGWATTDLAPRGTVQVESELWTAVVEGDNRIAVGEQVRVVKVEGAVLTVGRVHNETETKAKAAGSN